GRLRRDLADAQGAAARWQQLAGARLRIEHEQALLDRGREQLQGIAVEVAQLQTELAALGAPETRLPDLLAAIVAAQAALPESQDAANHILQRLSNGRLHVAISTRKENKTADRVSETLEILISDELGTRNYQMFSGGEAFRVNFALRLALSKLLARRAGA